MLISIAMTSYNGARYIEDQLNSFLEQDRWPDELIICDDASHDGTLAAIERFRTHSPFPVRIYINRKTLGYVRNFEKAIEQCQGDIILLSDQDDVWLQNKVSTVVDIFLENPEIGFLVSNSELVKHDLSPLNITLWEKIGFTKEKQQDFLEQGALTQLVSGLWFYGNCLAVRGRLKDVILPVPKYWEHDSWIPLSLTANGHQGYLIEKPLMKYRQHQYQASVIWERMSFLQKVNRLRKRKKTMDFIIKRLEQLRLKLPLPNDVEEIINNKIAYCRIRYLLPNNRIKRLSIIIKQLIPSRSYKHWKEPIIDFIF